MDSMQDYESLRVTKWGIRQHQEDEYKLDAMDPQESGAEWIIKPIFQHVFEYHNLFSAGLDLLIIPGLAFTADGHRLGRGAGYYDSYLRRYSECGKKMPDTIALAFSEQLRDSIPTEEHDFIIDTVLYP